MQNEEKEGKKNPEPVGHFYRGGGGGENDLA